MQFDISVDRSSDVTRMLEEIQDGSRVVFEPGEYHFYPEQAVVKEYCISNNTSGLKHVIFPIIGKKDIEIDGRGAQFVFHGEVVPFVVEESQNIQIKNFSIDWERPFYSQGKILSADNESVVVEIDADAYPYRIENQTMIFEGEGWESSFYEGIYEVNPQTRASAYLSGDGLGAGYVSNLNAEDLGEGRVRLGGSFPRIAGVGNVLILRHYRRLCPGIHLRHSSDIQIERVVLHHAGAMGVIAQFCENITLQDCSVTPSGERLFSTTVDATHFVNCRGQILIDSCLFENQLDDAVNIHGIYFRITKILAPKTIVAERGHPEQYGVAVGFEGDRLNVLHSETLQSYANATIREVEHIDEQFVKISLCEPCEDLTTGHILENMSWVPDVRIQNCVIRRNRARGILLTTPGAVRIEQNRIAAPGACIKISGDANCWFESGAVRDVLIRNNLFGESCYGPPSWGRAVIDIDPEIITDSAEPFHQNIQIKQNEFATFDVGILYARGAGDLQFSQNTVRRTAGYPMTNRMSVPIFREDCSEIAVHDNVLPQDVESSVM